MTTPRAGEGQFLGGRLIAWAPVSALRERRLVVERGQMLHALARAIPFQVAKDLHDHVPAAGLAEWEISAAGTAARGQVRRLTGQVEMVSAITCRFTLDYQRWQPDVATLCATVSASTAASHPARHTSPSTGEPVLIGYLITLGGAHTAAVIR